MTVPMEQVHQRTRQQKEACASPVNATRVALRWIDELMHLKRQSGSDGVIVWQFIRRGGFPVRRLAAAARLPLLPLAGSPILN